MSRLVSEFAWTPELGDHEIMFTWLIVKCKQSLRQK